MTKPNIASFKAGQGGNMLGCVAVPIVAQDIARNLGEVFALWADERFSPGVNGDTPRPHLMIVVNRASDDQLAHIQTLFQAYPQLETSFSGVSAHSVELEGERDIYAPDDPDNAALGPVFGRKAGPNFLFQRLIELGGHHGGFTLQLELDCLAVGAGWLKAVEMVIGDHPRAWVIGSHYAGSGLLGPDARSHLNGNALYRAEDPQFRAFFSDIWMPRLLHQIKTRPDLAYDWWWSVERFEADALVNNRSWRLFQTYDSFFHADPYIVNLAVPEDGVQAYARVFDRFVELGQTPVFLHGPAMKGVRRALLQQPQCGIFDVIDALDPPESSDVPARRLRLRPRLMRGAPAEPRAGEQAADAKSQDRSPVPQPPDQLLLRAAATLLELERNEIQAWLEPDCAHAQAIRAAYEFLGKAHPACVHFDRVRALARARIP